MHKQFSVYACYFFVFVLIQGCKKESDDFGPKVTFSAPAENQVFNVYDNVHVVASISDDTRITSVSVSLTTDGFSNAHVTVPVPASSPTMTLNMDYALDNLHLESGFYNILVTASDGENDSHTYRRIFINAVPRVVKEIAVISATSAFQTDLSILDSAFTGITPLHTFDGDFIGSGISSYYQQLSTCGNYTGDFNEFKLDANSLAFSLPCTNSGNPYFTGIYGTEQVTYIAKYDGFIRGYDPNGSLVFNASSNAGYYAKQLCKNSDYILAEEKQVIGSGHILVTYNSGGTGEQQVSLSQDVRVFCDKDPTNVFVFGNSAGQGLIQLYDRFNNNLWNPYPGGLPTGTVLSAARISDDVYLIGMSDGTIYKYRYSLSSLTAWKTGYTALQLRYDQTNDEVYVVESNGISSFNYATGTLHHAISSSLNILDAQLIYNR